MGKHLLTVGAALVAVAALVAPVSAQDDNYHTLTDAKSLVGCAGDKTAPGPTNFGRCPGIPWMFWYPEAKGYERRAMQNPGYSQLTGSLGVGADAVAPSTSTSTGSTGGMGGMGGGKK